MTTDSSLQKKTTDRSEPGFKVGDRVYFKNKTPGKWDLKWRAGYRIVQIEHEGHYLHIKTKLQEKSDPAMLRTLSLNQSVNCGM